MAIFVGFDGFVDHITQCISSRTNKSCYELFPSIAEFAHKITASSSLNIECLEQVTFGGNGPLLTYGLNSLLCDTTCVGFLNHPCFAPLLETGDFLSLGEPGSTTALEFPDGKIFLGVMKTIATYSMQNLLYNIEDFPTYISSSSIIASVNWTMTPLVEEFWEWLLQHPEHIKHHPILFVDFANPAKRKASDLVSAIKLLAELARHCHIVLSLNGSELTHIAMALEQKNDSLLQTALFINTIIPGISIVVHTPQKVSFYSTGNLVTLSPPYCSAPKRITGAGDMFNAGLIYGLSHQYSPHDCLIFAMATSGIWIRTALPPTPASVHDFFKNFKISLEKG